MEVVIYPGFIEFSDTSGPFPDTWDLSETIPNGVLDLAHIGMALRAGTMWSDYFSIVDVPGVEPVLDPVTKILTYPISSLGVTWADYSAVRFKRATPKTLYRDPLALGYRISERSLQDNANQGLFVAVEAAAAAGVFPYQVLLDERATNLPLASLSQNVYGPEADFAKRVWDCHFSGGYLDRDHVQVQAKTPSGWTLLDVARDDSGTDAPFRFVGDFKLFLDLATLGEVTGLIIFRHTPRNVQVPVADDGVRITAGGLRPGAVYAYFVAVELGEAASNNIRITGVTPGDIGEPTYGEGPPPDPDPGQAMEAGSGDILLSQLTISSSSDEVWDGGDPEPIPGEFALI